MRKVRELITNDLPHFITLGHGDFAGTLSPTHYCDPGHFAWCVASVRSWVDGVVCQLQAIHNL